MGTRKQASSSPNCVLEDYLSRLESETSSSKEGTSGSGSSQNTKPTWRGLIQLLRTQSKRRLATLDPRNVLKYSVRKCRSMRFSNGVGRNLDGETVSYSRSGWKNFTLSELQRATKNFSHGLWFSSGLEPMFPIIFWFCFLILHFVFVQKI